MDTALAPLLSGEVRRIEIEVSDWDMVNMSADEADRYRNTLNSAAAAGLHVSHDRDELRKVNRFVVQRGPIDRRTGKLVDQP